GSPPCRAQRPTQHHRTACVYLPGQPQATLTPLPDNGGSRNQRGDPLRGPTFACAATPPPRQKGGSSGSPVAPLADTCPGRRRRQSASPSPPQLRARPPQSPCRETTGSPP